MVAKFNFKTHLQNMFRLRFTSKFTKSANMTKPTFLLNFMLISNPLKKLQRNHAKKVISEKVTENFFF